MFSVAVMSCLILSSSLLYKEHGRHLFFVLFASTWITPLPVRTFDHSAVKAVVKRVWSILVCSEAKCCRTD